MYIRGIADAMNMRLCRYPGTGKMTENRGDWEITDNKLD
jgi:hypothetical protein